MCLSTKLVCLHHIDESWLKLESIIFDIDCRSNTDVAVVGAENSWRVLIAIALNSGVKLRLIWLSSDFKARTFLSLALVLLISGSRSSM